MAGHVQHRAVAERTVVIFVILVANTVLRYATRARACNGPTRCPSCCFPWLVMAGVVLAAEQGAHIATTFLMEAARGRAPVVAVVSWLVVAACTRR